MSHVWTALKAIAAAVIALPLSLLAYLGLIVAWDSIFNRPLGG